jgi:hypothetical protein
MRRRGPGSRPLPDLIVGEPRTTPFASEQRAAFVAIMSDMIVSTFGKIASNGPAPPACRRTLGCQRKFQVKALRNDPLVRMP